MQFNDVQEVIPMSRETCKFYVKLKFEKLSNLFHDLKCIEIISVYLLLFCLSFCMLRLYPFMLSRSRVRAERVLIQHDGYNGRQ